MDCKEIACSLNVEIGGRFTLADEEPQMVGNLTNVAINAAKRECVILSSADRISPPQYAVIRPVLIAKSPHCAFSEDVDAQVVILDSKLRQYASKMLTEARSAPNAQPCEYTGTAGPDICRETCLLGELVTRQSEWKAKDRFDNKQWQGFLDRVQRYSIESGSTSTLNKVVKLFRKF